MSAGWAILFFACSAPAPLDAFKLIPDCRRECEGLKVGGVYEHDGAPGVMLSAPGAPVLLTLDTSSECEECPEGAPQCVAVEFGARVVLWSPSGRVVDGSEVELNYHRLECQ